jgi:demethoxyubiquinone hydroxylase (CLK1/Coq7/Cat5 family)
LATGSALSLLGDSVSTSYTTGVKTAVSDYYNDQIREIYASKPDQVELKEVGRLLKKRRAFYELV